MAKGLNIRVDDRRRRHWKEAADASEMTLTAFVKSAVDAKVRKTPGMLSNRSAVPPAPPVVARPLAPPPPPVVPSASVAVLVPVLGRPGRVQPLVDSLAASVRETPAWPLFICSPSDREEQQAVREAGLRPFVVSWEPGKADWARKLNHAFRHTTDEWVFLGADDLRFQPGWADEALAVHRETGACVIGTNDLGNPRVVAGVHATHLLVHRDYGDCGVADDPSMILSEHYWHSYADDELVRTARARGTFAFARASVVEHLHPDWGKGEWDETYERGRSRFREDAATFHARQHLWAGQGRTASRAWSPGRP